MTTRTAAEGTIHPSMSLKQPTLTPEEEKLYYSFVLKEEIVDPSKTQYLIYDIARPIFSTLNHPHNKKVITFLFILLKKEWLIKRFLTYHEKPKRCTFDRIKDRTNITEKQFESIRTTSFRPTTYFDLVIEFLRQLDTRISEWIEYLKKHRSDTNTPSPEVIEALGGLLVVLGMPEKDIMTLGRSYIALKKQGRPTSALNAFFAKVIIEQLKQYRIHILWLSLRLNFTQLRRLHKKKLSMNVNKTGDGFNLRFFRRDTTRTEIQTRDTEIFINIFGKLRTAILKNKTDEASPMIPALHP